MQGYFDDEAVAEFAESTVRYLREVERAFGVTIRRIAIDAPSEPKPDGAYRRKNELGLAERGIRYIPTPDARPVQGHSRQGAGAFGAGGGEFGLPHANQLWMLAGFALFQRLRREWECLETFPQAIAVTLGAAKIHKSRTEGLLCQLTAAARLPDGRKRYAYPASRTSDLEARMTGWMRIYPRGWQVSMRISGKQSVIRRMMRSGCRG